MLSERESHYVGAFIAAVGLGTMAASLVRLIFPGWAADAYLATFGAACGLPLVLVVAATTYVWAQGELSANRVAELDARAKLARLTPAAVTPALAAGAGVVPGAVRYNVMGEAQAPLARLSEAESQEIQLRRECVAFLQGGHAIGDKWSFREMKAAGLLERESWDTCVGTLRAAHMLTSEPGRGTFPFPNYTAALDRLREGCPLPFPAGPLPVVARQHNTADSSTTQESGTAAEQP